MPRHPKPIVALSRCLEVEACRYDGRSIRSSLVRALLSYADVRPVCPEIEIGLEVPRDPIRLVARGEAVRLIQPSTGRDLTRRMKAFAKGRLDDLGQVDGFILKSRSPSCGIRDTKIFPEIEARRPVRRGAGVFGIAILERYPHAAITDEAQLMDFRNRHHFLTKLFVRARFRAVRKRGTTAALTGFHVINRFLLLAYHRTAMKTLDRLIANRWRYSIDVVIGKYAATLATALARPPRTGAVVDTLLDLYTNFADRLTVGEKADFLEVLAEYGTRRVDLGSPLREIHSWIARTGDDYLARQTFVEPYPSALMGA